MDTARLLVEVLGPIALVLGAGVLVGRRTELDPRPLSVATFWLFSPCLVLDSLVRGQVGLAQLPALLGVPLAVALVTWGAAEALLRLARVESGARDALLLGAVLTNAGNLGLPIVTFRWGAPAATLGALVLVGTSVVSATIGVWIVARGAGGAVPLGRLVQVPLVWAAAIGLACRWLGLELPAPVGRAVALLGEAAIPCMLVVLALQLSGIHRGRPDDVPWRGIALVLLLKLVAVPLLALGIGGAAGLEGTPLHVLVVQHAMPTAVFSVVLATEYDRAARSAAWVVVATTVAAAITVPLWLSLVG
jgi:hypothetical protein